MRQRHIFRQRRPTLIVFGINLHETYWINSTTRQYLPWTPASAKSPSNIGHPSHVLQQPQDPILQIIFSNLGLAITGRIRTARILKAQMDPLLQQLDPPHRPMRNNRSTANLVIRLQPLDLLKKEVNLMPPASLGIPTRLFHRGARSASRKRRRKVPNTKPHRLSVDDLITQIIRNILGLLPLTEWQRSSPNYIHLRIVGMGFQMEEILKQIKVGLDPKKASQRWTKIEM